VPLPWEGEKQPFGFSLGRSGATPWLPQPASWRNLTAERQALLHDSMLVLYRQALRIRRAESGLGDGSLRWLEAPDGVLAFVRGDGFACILNLSRAPVALPSHERVLLRSGPLVRGLLPPDTAAWLRVPDDSHKSAKNS
jgi:alpha-glucosidase